MYYSIKAARNARLNEIWLRLLTFGEAKYFICDSIFHSPQANFIEKEKTSLSTCLSFSGSPSWTRTNTHSKLRYLLRYRKFTVAHSRHVPTFSRAPIRALASVDRGASAFLPASATGGGRSQTTDFAAQSVKQTIKLYLVGSDTIRK